METIMWCAFTFILAFVLGAKFVWNDIKKKLKAGCTPYISKADTIEWKDGE